MSIYQDFDQQKQFACRVIADHARTTAFAIADGILPGNEGRNYVLRKIMRRAIYHGREHLGFDGLFFHKVCDFVVGEMKDAFPELEIQREFIGKMVRLEEERFGNTLTVGLNELKKVIIRIEKKEQDTTEIWEKAILGDLSPEEFRNALEEIQTKYDDVFSSEDGLFTFAREVRRNKIPLDIALDKINENVDIFHYTGEHLKTIPVFFFGLLKAIRKEGNQHEKNIISTLPDEKRWKKLNKYYNDYQTIINLTRIYDTKGVPKDLILVALEERDFDEQTLEFFSANFENALAILQSQGNIGKTQQNEKINPIYKSLEEGSISSRFLGYETTKVDNTKIIAIVKDNEKVKELTEGDEGLIVLTETPFYAEAGGQVGDRGTFVSTAYGSGQLNASDSSDTDNISKPSATADGTDKTDEQVSDRETRVSSPSVSAGLNADGEALPNGRATDSERSFTDVIILDTFAPIPGITLHKSKIKSGSIKVGDTVTATVDVEKRDAIRRNHTATHLVHAALKEILGTHVKQGGSVVAPDYLRFDFTHYQPLTETEIKDVEDLVNRYILENESVNTNIMSIDEAKASGAVALFGEKYGSEVRVLSVGDGVFSKELCGGTHVKATGDIGAFKITSDDAVASGVRRIRAITGFNAFNRFREGEILIEKSLQAARTQRDQLPSAIEKLQEELKNSRKEIGELKLKIASGAANNEPGKDNEAKEINGVKVMTKAVDDLDKGGMRHLSDTLMARIKSGVVIIGNRGEGKVSFIVRVSEDLTDKIRAGNIIKEIAPIVGGRGGGKPDMAEGGGSEPEKLSEAMDASYGIIEKMLK